jgi:hypothetical protein
MTCASLHYRECDLEGVESLTFFQRRFDVPSPHWKAKYVQLSLTTEAINRLKTLAMENEDEIPHEGTLKHGLIAHWAVHYVMKLEKKKIREALLAGKRHQDTMEAKAEAAAVRSKKGAAVQEPENSDGGEPRCEESPSVAASKTTTRVWTRRKKSGKTDADGLNGDRPTGRKVSNSPARK